MLIPAGVLAAACVVWGFLGPSLGTYMGIADVPSLLSSFLGLETVIFALILIPTGLLIYATYWKNYSILNAVRSAKNPISKLLNHGYFFDDFYEKVTARAFMEFSAGVKFFASLLP